MLIRPIGSDAPVPLALWLLVGSMGLIELGLAAADAGWIGTTDWRAITYVLGAFWVPLFDGTAQPLFGSQRYTMFVSHAFLHGGMLHLVMNGVILLALGKFISEQIGSVAMIGLFVACAIGGGLGFALLSQAQAPMIGASGAVFGFLGLWQYWEAMARLRRGLTLRPVLSMLGGLVVINIALAVALQGGLAWQAHLGGFVTGAALGPLMTRQAARRRAAQRGH